MESFINWEEIQKLTMPPMMRRPGTEDPEWERRFADFYNKMASMEKTYTLNQVNAIPLLPGDTLLDMGCGPGRLSVPLAQRVKSVTSLDMSEHVLRYCETNARAAGLTNLTTQKMNFEDAIAGENVERHDVVVCSRSVGLWNLKKLSSFAGRLTAIVTFANAPAIPQLLSNIFNGTTADQQQKPPFMKFGMNRSVNYNAFYNIAYDLGYEPNVTIVEDGFTRDYVSNEDAYQDIITLGKVDSDKADVFRKNLDRYLTENSNGGVKFFMETRTCVIWWLNNTKKFF
jgi:SAM-dependent methyltransferase